MPGFKNLGAPIPDEIAGHALRNICLSIPDAPEYRQAFWGQIWEMGEPGFWEQLSPGDDRNLQVSQLWRDLLNSQYEDYLTGVDCNPIEGCRLYPNTAAFISYYPNDPRYTPDFVPEGYNSPPWYFATGSILDPTGSEAGDILTDLLRFPPGSLPTILPASGLPRIRVWVNGEGQVKLHLRAIFAGSILQTTIDDDILTIEFTDLNLDILSVPPESNSEVIVELDIVGPGNHYIDAIIVSWVNDGIPFLFHGGGIRYVELCGVQPGQQEGFVLPTFSLDRVGDDIRLLADDVVVDTVSIADKVNDTGDTITGKIILDSSGTPLEVGPSALRSNFAVLANGRTRISTNGADIALIGQGGNAEFRVSSGGQLFTWYWSAAITKIADMTQSLFQFTGAIAARLFSSTNVWRQAFDMTATWAESTDASRKARMTVNVYDLAARPVVTAEADGSAEPKIAFRGETPIARPALAGEEANANLRALAQSLDDLGLIDNQLTEPE